MRWWTLALAPLGGLVAWLVAAVGLSVGKPVATNYRGRAVPAVLGIAVTVGICVVLLGFVRNEYLVTPGERPMLAALAGIVMVFLAGLYDDFRPRRTRGLRHQIGLALRGQVTPGLVKLVVIAAAAAVTGILSGRTGGLRMLLGIPLMAASANLWNLLDVRPGRAIKYFLVAAVAILAGALDRRFDVVLMPAIGSAVAVAAYDLRERAMLGDSGSNVLGFVIGIGLFQGLPVAGLAAVLGAFVLLHVLADTVTLSRTIEWAPPLRWFDGLGRRRDVPDRP